MLVDPLDVELDPERSEFLMALDKAWDLARSRQKDPMLVSWFDRERGRFSPRVTCCGEDEPAWLIYAKTRGADLTVSVNNEQFVFLFRDFEDE